MRPIFHFACLDLVRVLEPGQPVAIDTGVQYRGGLFFGGVPRPKF